MVDKLSMVRMLNESYRGRAQEGVEMTTDKSG